MSDFGDLEFEPDASPVQEFFATVYANNAADYYDPDSGYVTLSGDNYGDVDITPDGDVYGTYDDVKEFLQECDLTGLTPSENFSVEAHHLFQEEFIGKFGGLDTGQVPAVPLDRL